MKRIKTSIITEEIDEEIENRPKRRNKGDSASKHLPSGPSRDLSGSDNTPTSRPILKKFTHVKRYDSSEGSSQTAYSEDSLGNVKLDNKGAPVKKYEIDPHTNRPKLDRNTGQPIIKRMRK